MYASPYPVFASLLCAAFLAMYIVIKTLSWYHPADDTPQRSVVFFENYLIWWVLLLVNTIFLKVFKLGGGYFITFFYAANLVALLLTLVEMLCARKVKVIPPAGLSSHNHARGRSQSAARNGAHSNSGNYHATSNGPEDTQNGIRNEPVATAEREEEVRAEEHDHDEEAHATERTPLIPPEAEDHPQPIIGVKDSHWTTPLWGIEFILASAFPVLLVLQLALAILTGLRETLADGNNPLTVYLITAFFSILIVVPLAPFMHKIQKTVSVALLLVLVITVAYNALSFPFSPATPLKVYFQQTMDLDQGALGENSTVTLVGVKGYLRDYVIPSIPSGWDATRRGNDSVQCGATGERRAGLVGCSYEGLMPKVAPEVNRNFTTALARDGRRKEPPTQEPIPGIPKPPTTIPPGRDKDSPNPPKELLSFNATRISDSEGRISIKGANTRACRLYFDHPVTSVRVAGGKTKLQRGYTMPPEGINEVRLWSRMWDRTFEVDVDWEGKVRSEAVTGQVACEWAEMREERIPALDEIVSFLPTWAVITKLNDGLVEGIRKFEM